jgi:hypothetical protein
VAGRRPAVREAAKVVLRKEGKVRGVPQQVEEDEMALIALLTEVGSWPWCGVDAVALQ